MYVVKAAKTTFVRKIRRFNVDEIDGRMEKNANGSYDIEGMFAEVFFALKVCTRMKKKFATSFSSIILLIPLYYCVN